MTILKNIPNRVQILIKFSQSLGFLLENCYQASYQEALAAEKDYLSCDG